MKTRTVAQILTRARQWSDTETASGTVDLETDAELLVYLNEAYTELVDEILAANGMDLLLTSVTLTSPYSIAASNVYRSVALEVPNGTLWTPLTRFMFRDRNRYTSTQYPAWRHLGDVLKFFPETANPTTVRLWFIADATTFISSDNVPVWNGWDTYLSVRVAMKILVKEERPSSALDEEFKGARMRVVRACQELDLGSSEQVVDTMCVPEDLYDQESGIPEYLPRS